MNVLAVVCVALAAVGAVLSFVNLGALPFWVDEAGAVMPARSIHWNGLPSAYFDMDFMPWQIKHGLWDPATPLYRYAVGAFTFFPGFSEFTTRAFSLLMGMAAAIPFFALVRGIFGANTAWMSLAFLLTSPTWMIFTREARHYTFVLLLVNATLYFVWSAAEGRSERAKALWVVSLFAALLAQTLAYGVLPVVWLYAFLIGPSCLLSRRYWPVYAGAAIVFLAFFVPFWDTLPFFHVVDCRNRPSGCEESPGYYLAVLYEFLRPMEARHLDLQGGFFALSPIPLLAPLLFAAGLAIALGPALRRPFAERGRALVAIWFFAPLFLLSLSDVKFPRYLFQWSFSFCALFCAVAVDAIARLPSSARARTSLALALVLGVVAAPQVARTPEGWRLRSGLASYAQAELFGGPRDNFERMRWQVDQLAGRVEADDAVVTSYDDPSLQFYLDRPVYGFLSSRRSDDFFVDVLARAKAEGRRVWFVDAIARNNNCLTNEAEPRLVDCREKYRRFYEACVADAGRERSTCVHLRVPPALPGGRGSSSDG